MMAALQQAGYGVRRGGPEEHERRGRIRAPRHALRRPVSRSIATHIEGIIVTLPNFGDERAIADTLRWPGSTSRC